jgi:DNA repair protein RecO (recombination protein O)
MTERTRRISDEPAYVLHRRPYRETSYLVDLLTPTFGRMGVVARGVRGSARSRFRTQFEPFSRLLVSCSGRGTLLTVTSVDALGSGALGGDALLAGLYVNELLVRVLRADDAHPALFAGYHEAIEQLVHGDDLEPVLRRFEKLVLKESGYALSFDIDADTGEPIESRRRYWFTPELGFTAAESATTSRLVFDGEVLLAIGDDRYDDPIVRRAAKRIMRRAFAPYLGDRPLISRTMFARVRSS